MPQASASQKHEKAKGNQIGQAVPMHGQRTYLKGYGINLWVYQHAPDCAQAAAGLSRSVATRCVKPQ
jgi:hypothetical protein